jgi:hypothetical protein
MSKSVYAPEPADATRELVEKDEGVDRDDRLGDEGGRPPGNVVAERNHLVASRLSGPEAAACAPNIALFKRGGRVQ